MDKTNGSEEESGSIHIDIIDVEDLQTVFETIMGMVGEMKTRAEALDNAVQENPDRPIEIPALVVSFLITELTSLYIMERNPRKKEMYDRTGNVLFDKLVDAFFPKEDTEETDK